MEKVIEVQDLQKIYGEYGPSPKVALKNISLQINKGDFICVMGPSGSGKTTFVNILSTIDDFSSGKVYLLGKDIANLFEKEKARLRKSEIGFIFQNYNLIDTLKNKDNILFSLRLNNIPEKNQLEALEMIANQLKITDIINKYPFECSGGQQQRVAIARALITKPKILFADEPTGNIDSASARELMELFTKINQEAKTTIVMVSHDSLVASYSNKLFYIVDGKIQHYLERGNVSQYEYFNQIVKITSQVDFFK
ncbi:MAG: ABC transporter ATP-binding protein [Thomasclavelia sp.]